MLLQFCLVHKQGVIIIFGAASHFSSFKHHPPGAEKSLVPLLPLSGRPGPLPGPPGGSASKEPAAARKVGEPNLLRSWWKTSSTAQHGRTYGLYAARCSL